MPKTVRAYGEINSYNTLSTNPSNTILCLVGAKGKYNPTKTTASIGIGCNVDLRENKLAPTLQTKIGQHLANINQISLDAQFRTRTNLNTGDTKYRFALSQKVPVSKNANIYVYEYATSKNFKNKPTYGIFSGVDYNNKYIEAEINNNKEFMINLGISF